MLTTARPIMIYVLLLEGDRVYVGKSADVKARYAAHLSGLGSAWTKKWRPKGIMRQAAERSVFDEDITVKEYMLAHGIDKVRGGSYSQVELDAGQLAALRAELRGATDACVRCGRTGHFAAKCRWADDVDGQRIGPRASLPDPSPPVSRPIDQLEFDFDFAEAVDQAFNARDDMCGRCGRFGHAVGDCWAASDVAGGRLPVESAGHRPRKR